MTDHERFERLLTVPHSHTPEQREALEAHLQSCPACRATQTAYRRQDALIRFLPAATPLPGFRQGVRERIEARPKNRLATWQPNFGGLLGQAIAGAAIAVIIAGLVLLHLHSLATTGQKPTVAGNPSGGATFCATPGQRLTTNEMQRIRSIVAHRLHVGLGIKAPVRITGGSCLLLSGVHLRNAAQANLLTARGSLMVASYARSNIPVAPGNPVRRGGRLSCVLFPPGQSHSANNNCRVRLSVVVPDTGFRHGSAIASSAGRPRGSSLYWVNFRLAPSVSQAWCRFTARHVGKYAAFVLDNQVLSDPLIQTPICSGDGQIVVDSANSRLRARMIAAYINYGPLPAQIAGVRGRAQVRTPPPVYSYSPGPTPPAAQQLANRLGVHGTAFVGRDPGGSGGPWTVWFPRAVLSGSVGPGNVPQRYSSASGSALFTGPQGTKGEFHYFNEAPLLPAGGDKYTGPPLTRGKAVTIALAWLHRAGAPIPSGSRHVALGGHSTTIGGTGICCYKTLAAVYWANKAPGGWTVGFGTRYIVGVRDIVYIADRGVVVEMDIGASPAAGAETPAYPCKGDSRDASGVALGRWCFDYPQAARGIIFTEIGGHDGLILQPVYAAQRVGIQRHGAPRFASVHRISLTPLRGTYLWKVRKTTYKITVVPAFPGLVGSTWYVQSVRAQGRSK